MCGFTAARRAAVQTCAVTINVARYWCGRRHGERRKQPRIRSICRERRPWPQAERLADRREGGASTEHDRQDDADEPDRPATHVSSIARQSPDQVTHGREFLNNLRQGPQPRCRELNPDCRLIAGPPLTNEV